MATSIPTPTPPIKRWRIIHPVPNQPGLAGGNDFEARVIEAETAPRPPINGEVQEVTDAEVPTHDDWQPYTLPATPTPTNALPSA